MKASFLAGLVVLGLAALAPHPAGAATVRMFVRHEVNDYAAWRKVYDEFDVTRRKMGVIGQAVYCDVDDPNQVTVTHDFTTIEKAKAFAGSNELKEAMEKAGVKGDPTIWYTRMAASGRSHAKKAKPAAAASSH